jgi:hypothetical protein
MKWIHIKNRDKSDQDNEREQKTVSRDSVLFPHVLLMLLSAKVTTISTQLRTFTYYHL